MHHIQSKDQPGLRTHFAISCAHRQAYNCTCAGRVQTTYNVRFQTIARSVHHVGMSSTTSTACESKHEDTYITWVAHTKTLYNGTSTVRSYKYNHGQDRYIARDGHAKTLYKGYKHSTHCALVHAQYEYEHGQDRYIARAGHAKTLYKGYKHSTHCAMVRVPGRHAIYCTTHAYTYSRRVV